MSSEAGSGPKRRPTARPRYRRDAKPAWLSAGYRPFFLLAGLWSIAVLPLSVAAIHGVAPLPSGLDTVRWHFHELMFGYIAAAVAGFLLTAIPNWTGRLPLQGLPLLGLVGLWCAGRLAMFASGVIGPAAAAVLDLLFLAVLGALVSREIIAGRNRRNLPMLAILATFLGANMLYHAVSLGLLPDNGFDQRTAIACIALLIVLIGGRVTPSFTRNWLVKRGSTSLPKVSHAPPPRRSLRRSISYGCCAGRVTGSCANRFFGSCIWDTFGLWPAWLSYRPAHWRGVSPASPPFTP